MTEMERLAERCERAVYPAATDAEATELVEIRSAIAKLVYGWDGWDSYRPDWIGSIDAAMTLKPEWVEARHFYFTIEQDPFPPDNARAWAARFDHPGDEWGHGETIIGYGATPALALCAASLRARRQLIPAGGAA